MNNLPHHETNDARRLSPAAQEELRRQAIGMLNAGKTQSAVARELRVSRYSVNKWAGAFAKFGSEALKQRKRGRKPGSTRSALWPAASAHVVGAN